MAGVTLREVADRARVSPRTVSNVVNGYERVSEPLRARVLAAVDELGYRPNIVARNLKNGRTGLLALVIPEIDVPYFSELARIMIATAERRSYRIMIGQTEGDGEQERHHLTESTRALMFDGLIFNPLTMSADDVAEIAGRTPVVLLGEHVFDGRFDHVAIDNVAAARDATEHLIAQGRTRIAAIGADPIDTTGTSQLRTAGHRAALEAAGIPVRPEYMIGTDRFHRGDGAQAMSQLLALPEPPDAVFCYSDLLALGALKTVLDRGLRVPEDVALIGIDDIEDGAFSTPSLSTISPDKPAIAELAVNRLVDRIGDPTLPTEELVAPHRLIARASTTR